MMELLRIAEEILVDKGFKVICVVRQYQGRIRIEFEVTNGGDITMDHLSWKQVITLASMMRL